MTTKQKPRIILRNLASEAGFTVEKDEQIRDEPTFIYASQTRSANVTDEIQRLAFLIAEECAKVCEDEGDLRGEAGAMWAAHAIRQLFKATP